MDFETLMFLPSDCKRVTEASHKKSGLEGLFNHLFVNKNSIIKYSLESVEEFQPLKTPAKVWKDGKGHCFELSLFWLACLQHLKIKAWYCEKFPWYRKGVTWDHAFVKVKSANGIILTDPGRRIFHARFRKYRALNTRQTIGDYYTNCALMLDPYNLSQRKIKLVISEKQRLAGEAFKYAKLSLTYDSKQVRARNLLKHYIDAKIG